MRHPLLTISPHFLSSCIYQALCISGVSSPALPPSLSFPARSCLKILIPKCYWMHSLSGSELKLAPLYQQCILSPSSPLTLSPTSLTILFILGTLSLLLVSFGTRYRQPVLSLHGGEGVHERRGQGVNPRPHPALFATLPACSASGL